MSDGCTTIIIVAVERGRKSNKISTPGLLMRVMGVAMSERDQNWLTP